MKITEHQHYPKLLVFLQFSIIFVMIIFSHGFFNSYLAIATSLLGVLLGLWALQHNRLGNFNIQPNIKEQSKLITTGIYSYIRHPMYASVTLMLLGLFISTKSFVEFTLFIALVLVLLLKAKREESLWVQHDKNYIEYQKNSKFFIPFVL